MAGNFLVVIVRRVRALLESRQASFWVIGAWVAMTLVWLVPFQLAGQSGGTITAIAQDWFAFRVVYALVGLTSLLCAWTRMFSNLRRIQRSAGTQAVPTGTAVPVEGLDLSAVGAWFGAHGYAVSSDRNSLHAIRHRYSLIGGSVFHLGIVLFGLSLVVHLLTVNTMALRVTEGQTFRDAASAAGVTTVPSAFRYLTLESIRPGYYRDVLLFSRLDARVKTADGSTHRFSLSHPYWSGPTSLMSISDYNLAPHIEVIGPNGSKHAYVVAMNLVPPGAEDVAKVPNVPLEISMIVYPDHGVVDGRDVSLSYNIANPAFLVAVRQAGRTGSLLARKLVEPGQPVVAGDYTIRITQLSRTGTFRITTAPAAPLVALGLLTMLLGLVWRYGLRRHSVMAWSTDGGVLIDGWLDMAGRSAGRELAIAKLRRAGRGE